MIIDINDYLKQTWSTRKPGSAPSGGGGSVDLSEVKSYVDDQLAKLKNCKNVKDDYGAKGDGVTDDTQALIKAAKANCTVVFPEGNYILKEQITMTKKIDWVGIGNNVTITLLPADKTRPEQYGGRTVYNSYIISQPKDGTNGLPVSICNMTLDANKDAFDSDLLENGASRYDHTVCLDLYCPGDVKLRNVTITNALIEGCYIYNRLPGTNVLISDCKFIGNGFAREDASGLHIEGNHSGTLISNCKFVSNGFHGLLLGGCEHATISNILTKYNGYDGICMWGGASYNNLSNIKCIANRAGVALRANYSPLVSDAAVEWDDTLEAANNIISNLSTLENTYGLLIGGSNDNIISNWNCNGDSYAYSSSSFKESSITVFNAVIKPTNETCAYNSDIDRVSVNIADNPILATDSFVDITNLPYVEDEDLQYLPLSDVMSQYYVRTVTNNTIAPVERNKKYIFTFNAVNPTKTTITIKWYVNGVVKTTITNVENGAVILAQGDGMRIQYVTDFYEEPVVVKYKIAQEG